MVSVIIPTYNRSVLLSEAILSVYQQTYRPIECIVVDDGSTDDTFVLMKELQTLNNIDFKLKYIVQQNSGAQAARNRGINAAQGEYFQFLDSDDLLYPQKIENQVAYLQEHPTCDCVFGNWHSGTVDKYIRIEAYKSDDLIKQIITLECPLHTLSFLMRRTLVQKTGPWDVLITRMQEIDYQLTSILRGGVFAYQDQICGLWRYHEDHRIHNQIGLEGILIFYNKWERILREHYKFSQEISEKIADSYMWFLMQSKQQDVGKLLVVLEEAVRLNPTISFYNSVKMRLLRLFLGNKRALKIWLLRSQRAK